MPPRKKKQSADSEMMPDFQSEPSSVQPVRFSRPLQVIAPPQVAVVSPVLVWTAAICCLALLAAFGSSIMAGIVYTSAAMSCSESAESSNNFDLASISSYSNFVALHGQASTVKYFDVFTKSTAKCNGSTFADSCMIDVCTGTSCVTTKVAACAPTDKNCRLQEGFVNSKGLLSNWKYVCPNGCKDGVCVKTPICTDSDLNSNTGQDDPNMRGVTIGLYNGVVTSSMDYCVGTSSVIEFSCSSGQIARNTVGCPTGCLNGACVFAAVDNWVTTKFLPIGAQTDFSNLALSNNGKFQIIGMLGNPNLLRVSSDYGQNWTNVAQQGQWSKVAVSADGKYMTAIDRRMSDMVYTSSDHGKTWTSRKQLGAGSIILAMSASGQYQTAINGKAYYSIDYGVTWSLATVSGSTLNWGNALAMASDGKNQYLINSDFKQFNSVNYGQSWTYVRTLTGYSNNDLVVSTDGKYQVIIGNGCYVSNDFGSTWTRKEGCSGGNNRAVSMSSSGKVIIVADGSGSIFYSGDYGSSWQREGKSSYWAAVGVSGDGTKLMAADGTNGMVYYRK